MEEGINGCDARLIDACLRAGIDSTSPAAPASIREAVARFFEEGTDADNDALVTSPSGTTRSPRLKAGF